MERKKRLVQIGWKGLAQQPKVWFYILGILILILYHMRYDLSFGDVVQTYGTILKRGSKYFPENGNVLQALYNFTVFHYTKWSSRNIIEVVLMIVGVLPEICWHILDILTVVLIGYCLDKLVAIKSPKLKYLSIFSFLMMYQVITMRSAGWIATTVNYSWAVAMGLYMYLTIQRIRKGEPVSKVSYVLAILASLFAVNHEQLNGMMLLLLTMILVKDLWDKKFKKAVLPFLAVNLIEFLWILLCPGNSCRRNSETTSYYPVYEEYSFIHKVYEGISSLLRALFDIRGMVIITLTCVILLLYLVLKNKSAVWIKAAAMIPVFYTAGKFVRQVLIQIAGKGETNIFFMDYRESTWAAALGCMVLICIFTVCWHITRNMEGQSLFLGAFLAGAATKIVLGFSIAFYVSGERTSIYLTFILILAALFLIEKYEDFFRVLEKKKFLFGILLINFGLFLLNYLLIVSSRTI